MSRTSAPGVTAGPLRVALTTLGCKVNYAEMADLAGRLAAAGCEVVPDDQHADVHVLNSCTVTVQADATTRQRLRRLRRENPHAHVVLTGCSVDGNPATYLSTAADGERRLPDGVDSVFSNAEKNGIADHVLRIATARGRDQASTAGVLLRSRAFVKVQDGCNHRCTYCSVWSARGASRSLPLAAVLDRVHAAADAGHGEVVVCGVDLGSYGRGQGTSLARLVRTLLDEAGDRVRVRLSSVNSNDVTPELIALNAHPRLCSHWHMPLQSGSDTVLKAMHRGYRRAQYMRVCAQLRHLDPDTEFTTDVMVGFPGETDADHAATVDVIEEAGMLAVHAFRYSPRPGTPAAAIDDAVADSVTRRRSAAVRRTAAATGHARRLRAVGRRDTVVWDRLDGDTAHGVTATYLRVVSDACAATRPGEESAVELVAVEGDALHARLLTR
ncbi:MAG: tRNA (N(6)-L-threonylcarbamoyladenosine(37)-C(2))-methylthiotransferase MtaB [Candidatus Dormibacter sp.]